MHRVKSRTLIIMSRMNLSYMKASNVKAGKAPDFIILLLLKVKRLMMTFFQSLIALLTLLVLSSNAYSIPETTLYPSDTWLPNDPRLYDQYYLEQANDMDIDIVTAWEMIQQAKRRIGEDTVTPANVRLALMDFGVDITRRDFRCVSDSYPNVDPICQAHGRPTEDPNAGPGINMSAGFDPADSERDAADYIIVREIDTHEDASSYHATGIASMLVADSHNQETADGSVLGQANMAGMVGDLPISIVPYGVLALQDILAGQVGPLVKEFLHVPVREQVLLFFMEAFNDAIENGVRVINLSHSLSVNNLMEVIDADYDRDGVIDAFGVTGQEMLEYYLQAAYDAGIMVVVGAGNVCQPGMNSNQVFPSIMATLKDAAGNPRYPNLISVASTDASGGLAVPQAFIDDYNTIPEQTGGYTDYNDEQADGDSQYGQWPTRPGTGCKQASYIGGTPIVNDNPNDHHSSFGSNAMIAAPGVRITMQQASAFALGGHLVSGQAGTLLDSGTSYATPMVAGALAMAISVDKSLRPLEGGNWHCASDCDSPNALARKAAAHDAVKRLRSALLQGVKQTKQFEDTTIREQCLWTPGFDEGNTDAPFTKVCLNRCIGEDEIGESVLVQQDIDGTANPLWGHGMTPDQLTTLDGLLAQAQAQYQYRFDPELQFTASYCRLAGMTAKAKDIILSLPTIDDHNPLTIDPPGLEHVHLLNPNDGATPAQQKRGFLSVAGLLEQLGIFDINGVKPSEYHKAAFFVVDNNTGDNNFIYATPAVHEIDYNDNDLNNGNERLVSFKAFKPYHDTSNVDASVSYLWDFGDGTTSTEEAPVHRYKQTGEYTVTLKVTSVVNGKAMVDVSAPQRVKLNPPTNKTFIRWSTYADPAGFVSCRFPDAPVVDVFEGVLENDPTCNGIYLDAPRQLHACGRFWDTKSETMMEFNTTANNTGFWIFNRWGGEIHLSSNDANAPSTMPSYSYANRACGAVTNFPIEGTRGYSLYRDEILFYNY